MSSEKVMQFFEPLRQRGHSPSLVDQVVNAIETALRQRVLLPGMSLPSVRQFARDHGLSTFTVSAAYGRLVAQGKLHSRPGSGYRVAMPVRQAAPAMRSMNWEPPRLGASWLLADVFADHSIPIKSGCGWLPPEWVNQAGLQQALRHVARTPVSQVSGYGHPYGYHPLREWVQNHLGRQGATIDVEQVLLTQGATQALDCVIRTLLRPGQTVAVEQPCYANILPALRLAGVNIVGVPRTAEGLCIDALQSLARTHSLSALFVNTVLQNPGGGSLSMHNAFKVLQVAEQYNFRIIEDDVSRDLLPDTGPMLLALGGSQRVVHVSGFSKSILPSVRVGYVVADAALVKDIATTKMTMGLTSAELMERAVYQVLRQGRQRAYLQGVQERLRLAHTQVLQQLDDLGFEVAARPQAGLFLWARPPEPARAKGVEVLVEQALQHGIWLAPGLLFYPQGTDEGWLRLNVAYSTDPALWSFMRRFV
jgi:DNA-binding transcriptional MocR family regulator